MRRSNLRCLVLSLCLPVFFAVPSFAVLNNNVRIDNFDWQHAQTDHFDIYYDKKDEALLPRIAFHLENAWQEVGDKYNYHVKDRTPFFYFSNHNQFEQTNVVSIGEGTGGVTEAFKNRFLIFNDGSDKWLRHVIYHEFTHVVQFNVLYGGFWKSIRILKSPFYPLWGMEGMAEYGAGDIDEATDEMVIRDAVYTKTLVGLPELQGFNHLKPNQVTLGYKTGGAAIEFLADEYGSEKPGQLLVTLESFFDISSALEQLLGTDLKRFDLRFREWLDEKYADFFAHAKEPSFYGDKLTLSDNIPQFNECPVVSADGNKIYYFGDKAGPMLIYELDRKTKKSKVLVSLKWSRFENLHAQGRGLSLSRDGRWLAFAGEKKQRDFLYLFDLQRKKLKKIRSPLEEIRSPVFSPVDDRLVCIGMKDGTNDLYLINTHGEILDRLTNNAQDEKDPVFDPRGDRIVYSGEVLSEESGAPAGRDLYEVSLSSKQPHRLIALLGEEREPEFLPDGSLLFVRDRDDQGNLGFNLYRFSPDTHGVEAVTDAVGAALTPRYSSATNSLVYVGFYGGEKHLYDFSASTFTAQFNPAVVSSGTQVSGNAEEDDRSFDAFADETGEGVHLARKPALTQALQTWSEGLVSPLLQGPSQPYQSESSTDLFLPFFFYSSLDGFVVADIWQYSDLLGNHQMSEQMQYASGSDFLDLSMFYTYARFRPSLSLGVRAQRYYRDMEQMERRREITSQALISYPLDRVQSINFGVGVTDRKDTFLDDMGPVDNQDDRFYAASYNYDSVTGRYLVATQGHRLNLFFQQGLSEFGGNQIYRSGGIEGTQYVKLPRESTFATRLFYGRSVGPNAQVFRLGGIDRVRALSSQSEATRKHNTVFGSAELRFRLSYLNTRTKWLYPDFFFKAAYLVLFDDAGFGWDSQDDREHFGAGEISNSAGVGVYWPTFIIQSFQMNIGIQWAKRTDDGAQVWYITLGPTF